MHHRQTDVLRSRASEGRIGISLEAPRREGREGNAYAHIWLLKRGKINLRYIVNIKYKFYIIVRAVYSLFN